LFWVTLPLGATYLLLLAASCS